MSDEKFHEYDGIVEHNNPMPTWWSWSFVFTVIFAFLYYLHYEIAGGPTLQDELTLSMKELEKIQQTAASQFPNLDENQLLEKFNSATMSDLAQTTLKNRCTVCHGEKLEGKIGPNLLDAVWTSGHGTGPEIVQLIRTGVPAKGMPPWEGILKKEEIFALAAYLISNKTK